MKLATTTFAALIVSAQFAFGAGPQWRAFWVDGFGPGLKTPAQIDQLLADAKALNLNTLVVQVRKRGDALFRKSIEPFVDDKDVPAGFDPLAYLLETGHKAGLQIHAWVNVSTIWPANKPPHPSPDHVFNKHGPQAVGRNNWLSKDDQGADKFGSGFFVDPGHPDYQEHFARVCRDLVKNYPVDGIHFDYVRYSETTGDLQKGYGAGYNAANVERFNAVHGKSGQPDRADPQWQEWRRQQVTQLVRRVRAELLEENPKVLLSAALIPWGAGPADEEAWKKSAPYNRVFQNWHQWRKDGLLDIIIPMNYDRDANPAQKNYFDQWIRFETKWPGQAKSIVGIGSYMNSRPDTVSQVKRALSTTRDGGPADGVCFFNYAPFAKDRKAFDEFKQLLVDAEEGPFKEPAILPTHVRGEVGVICGRATDPNGKPVDSRTVTIAQSGTKWEVLTDGNGFFATGFLPPGDYTVTLPLRATSDNVAVKAGGVTRIGK